ncbi:conserved Plasmodium protein, unknown function [Babesia microti strain RI]|uniref:GRAM domain-containing protein n=1 Tax=Babesia microti (strain RI) TaxID=1133968 RepID=A0A1R4ABC3_BABMR|nr:conserved Plasmodium protein, unknown function [Babesia microti strain RI]SJK86307.1 conserved Plasmodium protein, unknown function [Babesia microti strain RI]|eukprot:XP_021338481.1 conserved Plasmodium protein, unknown function [Babesia microti strain RI]
MINLSTDENLNFIINVLEQTVDELKSNVNRLKLFINVKKENALLNKIYKYLSETEGSEIIKFKFPLKIDKCNVPSMYYSVLSDNKHDLELNNITKEHKNITTKTETSRSCSPISNLKSALFGITGFCNNANFTPATNEVNTLELPELERQVEPIDDDVSSVENFAQFNELGYQTFSKLNNLSSLNQLRSVKSDSFCTINETDVLNSSGTDDVEFYSENDDPPLTKRIIPDCIIFNVMYQKEKLFLTEFINTCGEAISTFNRIINDTNKFKIVIKNELKGIMSGYNIRDKQWSKVRANLIKNGKYLELCLGNSKGPYKIEGDTPGIVNGLGVKSILAYIRYTNIEREWQQVIRKAKVFIMQLGRSFFKLFNDFVKYYNDKVYKPSCKILKLFAALAERNELYSIHSTFSDDIYNESLIKTLSKQHIENITKLRKLRTLLAKYFALRSEKLGIESHLGSTIPSFPVAGVDISFFFFGLHTYYKLHKTNLSERRDRTLNSVTNSPQLSSSNSSCANNATSNANSQPCATVAELPNFNEFGQFPPFVKVLVDVMKPFKEVLPDDLTKILNQLNKPNEHDNGKKDTTSEEAETEASETMDKMAANALGWLETNDDTTHAVNCVGMRLVNKWLDKAFYNISNNALGDNVKEYSKCYKFQAIARLCYHHSYLNMNFNKGDIVKVYEPVGDIWWGSFKGLDGPFPAKCLDTRWIMGLQVDYEKKTELDVYITTPSDDIAYPSDINDVGISLFDKFNIPENCLGSFPCALHKKILLQGRLYISKSYLAFSSHFNDSTLFGEATILTVPIASIKNVRKGSKKIFSQSIEVDCVHNVYIFSSLISRNKVLDFINLLIKLKSPEVSNKMNLVYEPKPNNVNLIVPDELKKFDLFKDGYNQLEHMAFYLTTPMLIEDVFSLLFDLSQPPHRSVREMLKYDNFFYSVEDGIKVDALQDSDGLKINFTSISPSVTKRTLFYCIEVKQSSFNQMLGVPTKGNVIETITVYFIDDSNVLIESDTRISGLPFSDSFHNKWHILLKSQGQITSISGYYQVFIDHWIPFSNKVLNEAQSGVKQALECFADSSYQKMST